MRKPLPMHDTCAFERLPRSIAGTLPVANAPSCPLTKQSRCVHLPRPTRRYQVKNPGSVLEKETL
ncbi:MAG: hypothetical protein VX435_07370 [Planctomycetota bacterium]|nr:hypothetical protein [Planctomycetota bacterium]